MTSIGTYGGVPFQTTVNSIVNPPSVGKLISHTFSSAGKNSDLLSSKDRITISDEQAKFVSSYCFVGNGSTYCNHYLPDDFTVTGDWSIEFECIYTGDTGGAGSVLTTSTNSSRTTGIKTVLVGGSLYPNKLAMYDGSVVRECTTLLTKNTKYKLKVKQVGGNSLKFFIDNVEKNTVTSTNDIDLTYMIIGRVDSANCFEGKVWNVKIYDASDNLLAWYPGQQSACDVSGNGRHGRRVAGALSFSTQDYHHHNINYGFDKWTKSATENVCVPYINGVPATTDLNTLYGTTGYSKASSHPAGSWHNGAETKIVVGWSGAAKDANGWPACADSKFTTGAFKTQDGTIVSRANADPNEIFINVSSAPVGYCKEIDLNTFDPVQNGYYIIFDKSNTARMKNLLWWSSLGEPTNTSSVMALTYVNKTDFVVTESGDYLTDDDGHALCVS